MSSYLDNPFEASLRQALRGGESVPAGLKERLLARLRAQTIDGEAVVGDMPAHGSLLASAAQAACRAAAEREDAIEAADDALREVAHNVEPCEPPRRAKLTWPRRIALLSLAAACASVAAVGVNYWWQPWQTALPAVELAGLAPGWSAEISSVQWKDNFDDAELTGYEFPSGMARRPRAWQRVATPLDDRAVVYLLSNVADQDALLYVNRTRRAVANAPHEPPNSPQYNTGGLLSGVWQEPGEVICVLVVRGDAGRYRAIIGPGRQLAVK